MAQPPPAQAAVVYWGNNGLLEGNWSVPGGEANTVDTVENVFVRNPQAGIWEVRVEAVEINQDAHLASPEDDVAYALVVLALRAPAASETEALTESSGAGV